MRELLIYEQELDDVALLNTLVTFFSSAASAISFLVLGIVANALMQDKISDKAAGMLWFAIPAGVVLTVLFAGAALVSWKLKGSRVATMKQAAVDITQPNQQAIPMMPVAPNAAPPTADTQLTQSP
jgi:hypothetical protein